MSAHGFLRRRDQNRGPVRTAGRRVKPSPRHYPLEPLIREFGHDAVSRLIKRGITQPGALRFALERSRHA